MRKDVKVLVKIVNQANISQIIFLIKYFILT